ncbi:tRNA lysidine(34) synthetase TilS [Croceicoccus sp. YJ47]|uniref:tRNA lysidine(34) synthetase TilS n=1 Tax=Croceicoccus sp. YJ47 TaxID=2798724 RepID=UPI0019223219|nr:tRNA lysidine(34) synthetase TilS [Croceicoccus sp. YJ47]QQN75224.1 tRNA lysidine(34) synthetase TilS [Croceicoccus sp. YJ47]
MAERAGLSEQSCVGLAVSGGPDSMALLALAARACPSRIAVASVDHALRPEAAEECAHVAAVCAALGVRHEILRPVVGTHGNLQDNARRARYAALEDWAGRSELHAIVTAHHADDQAETMLMRLARGAGTRGVAGMREIAVVPGGTLPLLRPLLSWRRDTLSEVVADAGLSPVQDPSNHDQSFLRVRVRAWLNAAPADIDPVRMARSAAHLAEEDDALDWAARREWDERVERDGNGTTLRYDPAAPAAIRLRVLTRIMRESAREGTPRGDEIARLHERLAHGDTATLGGVLCTGGEDGWTFRPAPPRKGGRR